MPPVRVGVRYEAWRAQVCSVYAANLSGYFWRYARSGHGAAMQQVADWLEKLGMSEYEQRFAENRIDFSVLPDLTDQDLEKLGVVLGDRRKMLRAIGELTGAAVPAPQYSTATKPALVDTASSQ
jgi:SAM domain (Sterile alpha motif)